MNQSPIGAEWSPVSDGTVPMSNEARGHAINRRRHALGIRSLEAFAKGAGMARQTISRAEGGDDRVTESTFVALETYLDRLEGQRRPTSVDTSPAKVSPPVEIEPASSQITFRASGVSSEAFSIDELIVDTTAEHADEARRQFVELIQEIRRAQSGDTGD